MHPILSDKRKLASYIFGWLCIGVLLAKFLVLAELTTWISGLLFALPVVLTYGFIASSAYYVCRAIPMTGRRLFPTLLLFCGVSFIAGSIWLGLCLGWNNFGTAMVWWSIPFSPNTSTLLFAAGASCYLISMLLHDVLIAIENVRHADLAAANSMIVARDAELHLLRAQINPHFLFNSLNSISALTTIDPVAARSMTITLAHFFRLSLSLSDQAIIPLQQEIDLCNSFLEIEKIRFGNKLQHQYQLDPSTLDALLPPMLLQPLIENAIKHGIRDLSSTGIIKLTTLARDQWLHITIENPCDSNPGLTIGNGLGLTNIKQRLINIYGNQARILWTKLDEAFVVELTIPLQMKS